MLKPLIKEPRSSRERKEAAKRQQAVDVQLKAVAELGGVIAKLTALQIQLADDLRAAGVPMEGVIHRPKERP